MDAVALARKARDELPREVPGAAYVYNPLDYAWGAHEDWLRRYGAREGRILLVGMNPGPWGMGQTGVPFGDVVWVRDWMHVRGEVRAPARLHPKRPVTGFATTRREPSGSRLYGWASERFGPAAAFFERFFIVNYCPLLFFDEEGRNLTPPQLPAKGREAVELACDDHLADLVRALRPRLVVGVGQFAEERAKGVLASRGLPVPVGRILHPSPASPLANQGWAAQAEAQLRAMGVSIP